MGDSPAGNRRLGRVHLPRVAADRHPVLGVGLDQPPLVLRARVGREGHDPRERTRDGDLGLTTGRREKQLGAIDPPPGRARDIEHALAEAKGQAHHAEVGAGLQHELPGEADLAPDAHGVGELKHGGPLRRSLGRAAVEVHRGVAQPREVGAFDHARPGELGIERVERTRNREREVVAKRERPAQHEAPRGGVDEVRVLVEAHGRGALVFGDVLDAHLVGGAEERNRHRAVGQHGAFEFELQRPRVERAREPKALQGEAAALARARPAVAFGPAHERVELPRPRVGRRSRR